MLGELLQGLSSSLCVGETERPLTHKTRGHCYTDNSSNTVPEELYDGKEESKKERRPERTGTASVE